MLRNGEQAVTTAETGNKQAGKHHGKKPRSRPSAKRRRSPPGKGFSKTRETKVDRVLHLKWFRVNYFPTRRFSKAQLLERLPVSVLSDHIKIAQNDNVVFFLPKDNEEAAKILEKDRIRIGDKMYQYKLVIPLEDPLFPKSRRLRRAKRRKIGKQSPAVDALESGVSSEMKTQDPPSASNSRLGLAAMESSAVASLFEHKANSDCGITDEHGDAPPQNDMSPSHCSPESTQGLGKEVDEAGLSRGPLDRWLSKSSSRYLLSGLAGILPSRLQIFLLRVVR